MKFEFEINDLYDYNIENDNDLKNYLMENVVSAVSDTVEENLTDLYYKEMQDKITYEVAKFCHENKQDIIDRIVEKVADKILAQKQIKDQMPKKSEFNAINKEWSDYFTDLINKAIEKRFKQMWGYK